MSMEPDAPISAMLSQSTSIEPVTCRIYPSGDAIPRNILRFSIVFSRPMRRQVSQRFVSIWDMAGHEVAEVFMSFNHELWSPDSRRLTLLLDPGRIKRGVAANEALGPAWVEGGSFRFVIAPGWLSVDGVALEGIREKRFTVVEAERRPIEPLSWTLETPRAATRRPLLVRFDRPLDFALLQTRLAIFDPQGEYVEGTATTGAGESMWSFVPDAPWSAGQHDLLIEADLEDACGNRPHEALDSVPTLTDISPSASSIGFSPYLPGHFS